MKKIFTLEVIFFLLILLISSRKIFSQSTMEFQTGTTIEVQSGADICSDNVSIQGVYTGTGTLCNGPLPVELSTFTATLNKNLIELFWKTETEVNNFGFNVERKVNDGEWNMTAFIKGNGNSNSPKEYNYTDKDLFIGGSKFQYRLKQIDNDGKSEYSDIIEVEVVPNEYELSQNYPNPFNPSTTIQFSLPKASEIKLNLYNMLGELVRTIAEGTYEKGYHKVVVDAANLPSSTYIYRLESSGFVQVKKMLLLK